MRRATHTLIPFIIAAYWINGVQSQLFQEVPTNTCVRCGGSTELNCITTAIHPLGEGATVEGVGGQLWRIKSPNGNVTNLTSNMPDNLPSQYEFVSPTLDEYTGLIVINTTSIWNGTTFQCIAFTPANEEEQNTSAAAVTLEVGGLPEPFFCQCRCFLDTSDWCTVMWQSPPTVYCSSLQFNVSLMEQDGTLVYSNTLDKNTSSIQTTPLNTSAVYTATVTAENECGSTTCPANCSSAELPSKSSQPTPTPLELPIIPTPSPSPGSAGSIAGRVVGRIIIVIAVLAMF